MSKYSHFEMCEKIFGSKYKFDKVKELVPYSRTDMWDKMIEQKSQIRLLEKALKLACEDLWCMSVWENTKEEVIQDYIEHFKTKAKEMIKSE